jgi:23S rRNA pseudouridine2605 synthase
MAERPPRGPRRPSGSTRSAGAPPAPATRGRRAARALARPAPAAGAAAEGGEERIAKLLARAGVGSRRDIERMIAEGRVMLDGRPVTTPVTLVRSTAGLVVDGRPVEAADATRLFLFHKPAGVLTAARDPAGRPTIYDILPQGLPRLMPVGRLDLNTEGLLLLTNDGALKRMLELPSSAVPRSYRVRALGRIGQAELDRLAEGIEVDGMRYGPIDASIDRSSRTDGANIWLTMTLTEGKNREVRRVCEALGLKVNRLIRVGYGPYLLGDIPVRAVVEAPAATIAALRRMGGRTGPA